MNLPQQINKFLKYLYLALSCNLLLLKTLSSETIKYFTHRFENIHLIQGGIYVVIKNRFQMFNRHSGLWVKYDAITGKPMSSQRTRFKNIREK